MKQMGCVMKTILGLLLLVAAGPAVAADMPTKAPLQRVVVATDTWQGMYVGLHGGYNLGAFNPAFGTGETASAVNLDDNSPFIGGHIGYLVQNGGLVIGPEFGVQYWGHKGEGNLIVDGEDTGLTFQQKVDWVAYANVRVGITPFASTLLYVTGGAAWAHVKGQLVNVAQLNTAFEQSILGWNAGAGVEFKLTERLTVGAEYRHYDFGSISAVNPALLLGLGGIDQLTTDQLMGRLSYRLN